jgi:hypothetical protein
MVARESVFLDLEALAIPALLGCIGVEKLTFFGVRN